MVRRFVRKRFSRKIRIKDLPKEEQPQERLIRQGVDALSDAELLAVIIRIGNERENALELSRRILKKFNIKNLSGVSFNQIKKFGNLTNAKASQILACFELARRLAAFKEREKPVIKEVKDVVDFLVPKMRHLNKEVFKGIYLDSRNRFIKEEVLFVGTLNESLIHPREIFKTALVEGATAVILAHNHPSGDPEPSKEDIRVTKKMIRIGELMDILVLDHIIIGDNRYVSMKEKNYI